MNVVSLQQKLATFSEHWAPRTVAALNDYEIKVVKVLGHFVWHQHEAEDEMFLVLTGVLTIQLRDRDVVLSPGELFIVPRGVEHRPFATEETHIMLFEPAGTINTGNAPGVLTVENPERI